MLVICDFDGTITLQDVTDHLLDHFTAKEWRKLLEPFHAGEISHMEIMQKGYAYLKTPEKELLDYARQNIQLRPSFKALLQLCAEKEWPFVVVSGGLDFYIKALLEEGVEFYSYQADYNEYWRVRLPAWPILEDGQDFKVRIVEELQLKYPGQEVAFIGDGRNDFQAGSRADYLFTVAGSRLSRLCNQGGKPHTEFTTFGEVIATLQQLENGKYEE
ncbi:MAG: MtnX-like HAD-IB family phosphatase [Chloroflexi bacterium]|nr:MtnX-like HAD-IB family phosphatase [Chloroflexota bacterium]